ncbi:MULTISPECIES: extracellular solute-binding protein [unclassified Microbacterium]|uniref:extracellular solute-binding protein n=1 Tax=unclassified Microbacterium TaxID=2609290 RepID=UPI002041DA25|nr:extracellular solute-binding protein [Microbacterium sp. USTB-Y]
MRSTRFAVLGVTGVAAALVLAGCSGGSGGSGSAGGGSGAVDLSKVDGKGKTLAVWVMNGDLSDETIKAVNDEFEKATGAKVDVQMQQWDGITTKLTTALAGNSAPDVIDVGNTQVASYAATGGLADLTAYRTQLEQGQKWLGGLVDPATVDGKLYAVPSFAGDRAVVYNKKVWADAGVTEVPKTYEELTAALDKIKAKNTASDFSAFYLPGQFWYAGMQFVWDAGGEIATAKGGTWSGGLSGGDAQKGLKAFTTFQNAYSTPASITVNTNAPDQDAIFANGQTSAVLATAAHVKKIQQANPALTDDVIGTFPFPGVSGKNQPVMLGGSDWGVAQKSKNQQLALAWIKIAASPSIQHDYVFGKDNWIPNSEDGIKKAQDAGLTPKQEGFFTAALISKATPAAADWTTIEGDKTMEEFFQSIAKGEDPASAAKTVDAHIASTLNGK